MQRPTRLVRLVPFVPLVLAAAVAAAPRSAIVTQPSQPAGVSVGSGTARATSEAALHTLLATSPAAHAVWRLGQVGPAVTTGLREDTEGGGALARALSFVQKREALVGISANALRSTTTRTLSGRVVVDLQQTFAGKDVLGHTLAVTLDDAGHVLGFSNDTNPVGEVAPARVSIEVARATALAAAHAGGGSAGRAVVVADAGGAFEAAVFLVAPPGTLSAIEVVVNLHDGSVSSIHHAVRE
jgi:hypothetical protein